MAKETEENYFVLVVEGDPSLKQSVLHYEGFGVEEKLKMRKSIESSSYIISSIWGKLIVPTTPEEIEPDITGYWLKKALWSNGAKLQDWITTAMKSKD